MANYIQTNDPLKFVTFYCKACRDSFRCEPARVVEAGDQSHPWNYFALCPVCEFDAGQIPWEKATMQSLGKHTGPKTAEGKAASAANLEGHPTPEEAARTRFNAIKTGLYARTAKYYPARPGKYDACNGCSYYADLSCNDETPACMRRTELFLVNHLAFESGDPRVLTKTHADRQAMVASIIDDMLLAIVSTGVELRNPEWYFDPKEGQFHIVSFEKDGEKQYSYKISAHPLLKTLTDFLQKNNMSLADLQMTPKVNSENDLMQGYLDKETTNQETMESFQRQQTANLEQLRGQIARSRDRVGRDPVLVEYTESGND